MRNIVLLLASVLFAFLFVPTWSMAGQEADGVCTDVPPAVELAHTSRVEYVGISSDGKKILTWYADGISIWDATTGEKLQEFKGLPRGISLGWKIAMDDEPSNTTHIWDGKSGEKLHELTLAGTFRGFSPDGKKIVTHDEESGTLHIRNIETGKKFEFEIGEGGFVNFFPGGKKIVTWSREGVHGVNHRIWNTETGEELKFEEWLYFGFSIFSIYSMASLDGKKFIALGEDKDSQRVWNFWDTVSGERKTYRLEGAVSSLSPDAKKFATVYRGNNTITTRIWDTVTGEKLHELEGDFFHFFAGGRKFATMADGVVRTWDTESGEQLHAMDMDAERAIRFPIDEHFSTTERIIFTLEASESWSRILRIWDIETGKKMPEIEFVFGERLAQVHADDKRIVVATTHGGSVRVWNFEASVQECIAK